MTQGFFDTAQIHWQEADESHAALWRSESGWPAPKKVMIADDRMSADTAYRFLCEGTALLWRGDFQNARQLLQALGRRIDAGKRRKKVATTVAPPTPLSAFHLFRQAQAQRAQILSRLLISFEADYSIPLRRAPDVQLACVEAYGSAPAPFVIALRELLGVIGAHEWRKKGVFVEALGVGARIYPHYGVFSPVRQEYIHLLAQAPLPSPLTAQSCAFDIGTGSGVLAAVLAQRGFSRVLATDMSSRALTCAAENLQRLGLTEKVDLQMADLFPSGRAALIVCNPPWLPARPSSLLEQAVYDPESRMLRGFLFGVIEHLEANGEAWLILSDLAEHLGLRTREALLEMFALSGLRVIERHDARPVHPRANDPDDPLHAARAAEVTSLWRLCCV